MRWWRKGVSQMLLVTLQLSVDYARKGNGGKLMICSKIYQDAGVLPTLFHIEQCSMDCDWRQFKEAALVLDEMVFKGFEPRLASTQKLVEVLCEEGSAGLLGTVLTSLGKGKGKFLHVDMWGMLTDMVCKKEKLANVFKLVDSLVMQM